jgi:hypothetical protein
LVPLNVDNIIVNIGARLIMMAGEPKSSQYLSEIFASPKKEA